MPSGFDPTTTPGKQTTNVAVISCIYPKGSGTRVPIGVTKGGADFQSGSEARAAEYDGRRHIAAGTDEFIQHGPSTMTGTYVEFPEKLIVQQLHGATESGGVYTPLAAGVAIAKGDLLEAPRYEVTLKDGSILRYDFDYGFVKEGPNVNTKDKDEASTKLTIESRVDPEKVGYSTDDADYTMTIIEA